MMDDLHQPYDAIMSMPCGRRRRLCEEKDHLNKWRAAKQKQGGTGTGLHR